MNKLFPIKSVTFVVLQTVLGDNGVFLYPTFTGPAYLHNQIFFKFFNTFYCTAFNIAEIPATACPLGLNSRGLPIGIQVSSVPYNYILIHVCRVRISHEFWHVERRMEIPLINFSWTNSTIGVQRLNKAVFHKGVSPHIRNSRTWRSESCSILLK